MTIKSGQIGAQIGGNALSQWSDKELYGRVPGPGAHSSEPFESSATERANALAWALRNPVAESPEVVIHRANAYLRYLAEGII